MATGAGYRAAHRLATLDELAARIDAIFDQPGPVFINLDVEQGAVYPQDYDELHSAERRARFKRAVNRQG